MPTSSFVVFDDFAEQVGKGVHNFASHTIKLALTNTAPVATTNTVLADITQIANGGGYTGGAGGGYTLTGVSYTETGGTATFTHTDPFVITATGGAIATFRYVVYYNDSATSPADALIGYLDYGSALTLADTETLSIDPPAGGCFQVTTP
jgi:hypothetical protein